MSHTIDHIMALFNEKGNLHYGEDVTQLEHALQCANLAKRDGRPDYLVAAALLHDIGHLIHTGPEDLADQGIDDTHEAIENLWLKAHFPAEVTEPIRLHVEAKRYLTAVEPEYLDLLSEASRKSLALQGGPMDSEEIKAFEANPHYQDAVTLRRYDDMGKDSDLTSGPIENFRDILEAAQATAPSAK